MNPSLAQQGGYPAHKLSGRQIQRVGNQNRGVQRRLPLPVLQQAYIYVGGAYRLCQLFLGKLPPDALLSYHPAECFC